MLSTATDGGSPENEPTSPSGETRRAKPVSPAYASTSGTLAAMRGERSGGAAPPVDTLQV